MANSLEERLSCTTDTAIKCKGETMTTESKNDCTYSEPMTFLCGTTGPNNVAPIVLVGEVTTVYCPSEH